MKKLCLIIIILLGLLVFSVNASETIEVVTFAWDDTNDPGAVKNFEMYWGVTAGGPYIKLAVIPYALESPVEATVTGSPGTTETRYFVLTACGDIIQEDGSMLYMCSGDDEGNMAFSNEVSYDFWIEADGFSVPVQFRIISGE